MCESRDSIDYWIGKKLFVSTPSSMVPSVGSKISIRKEIYLVLAVTFAVDYADDRARLGMRANVDIIKD
jgi:hypothetical protein